MHHRTTALLFAVFAAAGLVACGGGGGGGGSTGGPPPVPTPSPSPTPTLAPGCTARAPQSQPASTYSLQSNPTMIVQRVDPTNTTCVYLSAVTPATDIPPTAPHPWWYVFAPTQANPYTVTVTQTSNGPHTIYYNQNGDSSGTVTLSSLQSLRRTASLAAVPADQTRRGLHHFSGAGVVADRVLVRYAGAAHQGRAAAARIEADEGGGDTGVELVTTDGSYEHFVRVPGGTTAETFASALRRRSGVADVYPVHKRFALGRPATTVNDPHMQNGIDQWYLSAGGFPYAWSYSHGDTARIAVIDTGIDLNNPDLTQNLDYSHGYKTTGLTAQDTNGHGTNVTGIAAAIANNAVGFAGAGYNVRLLAYNIFPDTTAASDQQTADTVDESAAIQDAVARNADVINLSLGSAQDFGSKNGFDQGEHDAVEAAIAAGVVVVAAAGNDADGGESGTLHTDLDYPAAYDGVIAVGASALHDNAGQYAGSTEYVAPYSQYGTGLGVVAPGGDPGASDLNPLHWIWNYSTSTANYASDKCKTPSPATSCTAFFAGTSQGTPQVSAAAALLIAAAGGHHALTPARVAQLIDGTADNINDPHQGHGRLNIYRAIAALTGDTGAYSGPTVLHTSPTQLVAFAYDNSGGTTPHILDANYPSGVPVDTAGNFRLGDVPVGAGSYRVGVWYDANGDGVVDAGDQFGAAAVTCNAQSRCTIGAVTLQSVPAGFRLP